MENSMFELADKLKKLKNKKKAMELEVKELNADIEMTEVELSESMVEEEMQNFKRGGTIFYLNTKTYASAVPENKQELFKTLKNEGYGDLIYETVNSNSLSAFVKEQILINDDELPKWLEGLIYVFEKTTIGIKKG